MILEIRKANRSDLLPLLNLMCSEKPVIDRRLLDRFDEILSQTNHSVLLAEVDGEIVGTLSVSIIDGIGSDFPFAVIGGGKIKPDFCGKGVDRALASQVQYIAAEKGCKVIHGE
ncbi:MAG: GNAT family N-acetyltransferase [Ruminococcus sp.]|nr:GNAT family N-acetyltransferase [Ruminococcus sp.]